MNTGEKFIQLISKQGAGPAESRVLTTMFAANENVLAMCELVERLINRLEQQDEKLRQFQLKSEVSFKQVDEIHQRINKTA